uniref:Fucosyltransferase C-terminal domain-containing protein n=1 Tax=viral metagenome TaxID=1070528 RepID=A0A6C0AKP1_9ZZZZ
MKIAFWENQLTLRGTTVACYDYALGNKNILGNESIVIYDTTQPFNDATVLAKFQAEFKVFGVTHFSQVDQILLDEKCDMMYVIEGGDRTELVSKVCKTMNHCVFNCHRPHGDIYASIAPWVQGNNGKYPFVPHIMSLPDVSDNLRAELGIPESATVFGRHGGYEEFNIGYVKRIVYEVASAYPSIYFLFMNTRPFGSSLPNVIHLPPIVDLVRKVRFINTCDAMIHAREMGEVFSCSMGEFAIRNKPIFCTESGELGHRRLMGDRAFWYTESTLSNMLTRFDKTVESQKDWNTYRDYTPEKVMAIFKKVFIDPRPLRVFINGFWGGFVERTNGVHFGFFEHILTKALNRDVVIAESMNDADILLESHFSPSVFPSKRWIYSIFFSGEASLPLPEHSAQYSAILGVHSVSCPLYLPYDYCKPHAYQTNITTIPPKKICAVISSAGTGKRFRNDFIDELMKRGIHVDMGGSYKNNIGHTIPGSYDEEHILQFQSQYRVVLALENTEGDHYITEKVINPLRAGTIPVYYGSKRVTEYINPDRFVPIDPTNIDAAISEIQRLCEDDAYWLQMVNQPCFVKDMTNWIGKVVNDLRIELTTTNYSVELIGDLTREPERTNALRPIMDFYHVSPSVVCYGEGARNHRLFGIFDPRKKINAVSLAINHIALLEKYAVMNQYVVVFESDAIPVYPMDVIDSEIRKDIDTMRERKVDFAFIGFGCFGAITNDQKAPNKKISPTLWLPPVSEFSNGCSRCTEAYIASPGGIRSFLNWFRPRINHDVIDWSFNHYFRANPSAIGCWRSPELFRQGSMSGMYPSLVPQ